MENDEIVKFPSDAEFLAKLDTAAGWPPRFQDRRVEKESGESSHHQLKHGLVGGVFDVSTRQERIQASIRSPEIRSHLIGRWAILGVHRLNAPIDPYGDDERVRVCIFNYTRNTLIDVFLTNGVVDELVQGLAHQHPESAMEVAQAIAIARGHPELVTRVKELVPQGILRVPTQPGSLSYGHRCIEVFFTESYDRHREPSVLFSALVDLTLQQVVSLGSCHIEDQSYESHPNEPKR
jgi:hypothetical protein